MNLNELQSYVWAQTDTTDVDLSGPTIEAYLNEAFTRTISAENQWPFYEQGWQLAQNAGESWLTKPIDMDPPSVLSIYAVNGSSPRLEQISQEEAEDRFSTVASAGGTAYYYSFWASRIWLWPLSTHDDPVEYIVRGYRKPLTMFDASTGQVDADPRLHRPLAHYAIALAYAQQEDEVLESRYMDRWQRDVEMARQAIMEPPHQRPLVMHGNFRQRRGVPSSNVNDGVVRSP